MKTTLPLRGRHASASAFTMIECLVYFGVYLVLMGLATFAFYRCYDHMKGMRRNSEDIRTAVHAGEAWRQDVRQATKPIVFEAAGQVLRIPRGDGEVVYRFTDGQVLRQSRPGAAWTVLVPKVRRSEMQADPRAHVTAWRWELELDPHQKTARVRPLFTFIGVTPS